MRTLLKSKINRAIVTFANLPYLSTEIYKNCPASVKNFEPEMALPSGKEGLDHYKRLFKQILDYQKSKKAISITLFIEISPEQKELIKKELEKIFSEFKLKFYKDLSQKWRLAKIEL